MLGQQQRLENLNTQLLDTNRALSIFAQNIEHEREEIEKRIALKLRKSHNTHGHEAEKR